MDTTDIMSLPQGMTLSGGETTPIKCLMPNTPILKTTRQKPKVNIIRDAGRGKRIARRISAGSTQKDALLKEGYSLKTSLYNSTGILRRLNVGQELEKIRNQNSGKLLELKVERGISDEISMKSIVADIQLIDNPAQRVALTLKLMAVADKASSDILDRVGLGKINQSLTVKANLSARYRTVQDVDKRINELSGCTLTPSTPQNVRPEADLRGINDVDSVKMPNLREETAPSQSAVIQPMDNTGTQIDNASDTRAETSMDTTDTQGICNSLTPQVKDIEAIQGHRMSQATQGQAGDTSA